jgi:hypothetical protein
MSRVIGTVARWTARTSADKAVSVPGRLGPLVGGFLQRIAVLIPTPQLVEGSLPCSITRRPVGSRAGRIGDRNDGASVFYTRALNMGASVDMIEKDYGHVKPPAGS